MMRRFHWLALSTLALAACGGGVEEDAAAPEPVAIRRRAAMDSAARAEAAPADQGLSREVFGYSGGARDPFESLLTMATAGPELPDLSLVAIYIDHRESDRSVAVVRERVSGKRYNLHQGDRLGRLRVASVRERDVDFVIDDFGTERRETLSLRRPSEEQTP
jgi:hypothetical protein